VAGAVLVGVDVGLFVLLEPSNFCCIDWTWEWFFIIELEELTLGLDAAATAIVAVVVVVVGCRRIAMLDDFTAGLLVDAPPGTLLFFVLAALMAAGFGVTLAAAAVGFAVPLAPPLGVLAIVLLLELTVGGDMALLVPLLITGCWVTGFNAALLLPNLLVSGPLSLRGATVESGLLTVDVETVDAAVPTGGWLGTGGAITLLVTDFTTGVSPSPPNPATDTLGATVPDNPFDVVVVGVLVATGVNEGFVNFTVAADVATGVSLDAFSAAGLLMFRGANVLIMGAGVVTLPLVPADV
jgi:hypothetical protein